MVQGEIQADAKGSDFIFLVIDIKISPLLPKVKKENQVVQLSRWLKVLIIACCFFLI